MTCENGGQYEVRVNTHQASHDISQHLSAVTYLPPKPTPAPTYYYPKPPQVTYRPNPFVNQLPTTQVVPPPLPKFEVKPPQPYKPVYQPTLPPFKPAPVYQYVAPTLPPYKPQPAPIPQRVVAPTLPPFKPQPVPVYQPVAPTLPPFQFKPQPTRAPTPFVQPQTIPPPPPPPKYDPQIDVRQERPAKYGVPKPVFTKPPELNILPVDQLPQGAALDAYVGEVFNDFMSAYKRQYIDEPHEKEYRLNVFKENFLAMSEHSRSDRMACEYSVTEFSDLTESEFGRVKGYKGFNLNATDAVDAEIPQSGDLPEKYDQRDENLVTRVKLQGDCGACWAFVTVAVIEGVCAKRTKKLQEFSEQSLLDCDAAQKGCSGGVPPKAVRHIFQRDGLELESVYPYVFAKSSCKFNKQNVRVKVAYPIVGFKGVNEEGLARWLYENGPIMVSINSAPLKHYKKGIINPTPALCNPKQIDHGVVLIGFGVEVTSTGERLPYWIVKNHWGTNWGEDGFFRIARGKNACGIALYPNSVRLANIENNCLLNGA